MLALAPLGLLPAGPRACGMARCGASAQMSLKLELNPEEAARLLEDGPAASQGPFGKGGALEGVANTLDSVAEVTLGALHAFDDKEVQDSSKNLQVRATNERGSVSRVCVIPGMPIHHRGERGVSPSKGARQERGDSLLMGMKTEYRRWDGGICFMGEGRAAWPLRRESFRLGCIGPLWPVALLNSRVLLFLYKGAVVALCARKDGRAGRPNRVPAVAQVDTWGRRCWAVRLHLQLPRVGCCEDCILE